jgi:hypothetical protein
MSSLRVAAVLVALVAFAACERGTLQGGADAGGPPRDGGGDGAADVPPRPDTWPADAILDLPRDLAFDLGADVSTPADARDGGMPGDAATDGPPVTGRRSFTVDATFTSGADGGTLGLPGVSGQSFTLVLDADAPAALAGNVYGHTGMSLASGNGRSFGATAAFSLGLGVGCSANATYSTFTFTIDGAGNLTGSGRARVFVLQGDVAVTAEVNVSLSGRNDTTPPTLTGSGGTVDPLRELVLRASEPLPTTVTLALAAGTDRIPLATPPTIPPLAAVSMFTKPNIVLRYGTTYTVALDGYRDFAGNLGTTGTEFTLKTLPAPDLAAEDGFESATGTTLGGARLISGAGMPVLTGTQSLYAPPPTTPAQSVPTPLALRLPVAPGDRFIRFSYRQVAAFSGSFFQPQVLQVGSVGGTPANASLPVETAPATSFQMPDGTTIYLGTKLTAEIPLPAGTLGTTGEVVVQRALPGTPACGLVPPPPGLIVDDVRVEP